MFYAAKDDTVKVHYTGKLPDGTIFDTSTDKAPLQFIIGRQEVIPGFEEAVMGMVMGEQKTATVPADQAYGASREDLVEEIPRADLPEDIDPRVGAQLEVTRQDGSIFHVMVVDVGESTVTLDANHPLAGRDLIFELELLEIKKKSPK